MYIYVGSRVLIEGGVLWNAIKHLEANISKMLR